MRNGFRLEHTLPWKVFVYAHRFVLGTICLLLVLAITASVIMRYIFETDLFGIEEIEMLLAMWMYFVGGTYASYERSHITADITDTIVKNKKVLHYIKIFVTLVSLLVSVFLAIWGIKYFQLVLTIGGATTGLKMPVMWLKLPMTLGFILMVVFNLYQFVCEVLNIKPIIVKQDDNILTATEEEGAL